MTFIGSLEDSVIQNIDTMVPKDKYDIILSDIPIESSLHTCICPTEKSFFDTFVLYKSSYKSILVIIAHHTLDMLLPVLLQGGAKVTLIDFSSGVFSHGKKSCIPVFSPCSLLDYSFEVYYPVDHTNLSDILNNTISNKYIQINEVLLPEKLSANENVPITVHLEGDHTLFLSIGYIYTQVGALLTEETFSNASMIVYDKLVLSDTVLSCIKQYKHLVVIIDDRYPSQIKKYIHAQLSAANILHSSLSVITPKYDQQNTIFPEYQLQEVCFDTVGILKQLQEKK